MKPDDDEPGHRRPEYWMEAEDVEDTDFDYSDRGPDDWIVSGPLVNGSRGRVFPNWAAAERWAREKYGVRFLGPVQELRAMDAPRWAFHIRGWESKR